MLNDNIQPSHVAALAEKLVTDIQQRGLAAGDRYLTADIVSRMLGVRKALAGQAVRHLAKQDILITKPRSGTFVGPGLKRQKRSKVRTIHVLLPMDNLVATHWPYEAFIAGIRSVIPGINVQFTFVPENDSVPYVRELIEGARTLGQFAGVVSVTCPPEVYRFLAELHVPAVVYGSLYSSELPIASVDIDRFESGRLLTQHLIERGHRRIAVLAAGGGHPGDHNFLDGISDAMDAAGLPSNALIQRLNHSSDIEAFRETAKELLTRTNRPTAAITTGDIQAGELTAVASALGIVVPNDLEIALELEIQTLQRVDLRAYPRMVPDSSFIEIAGAIGKLLEECSEGEPSKPRRVVIPVKLHESERNTIQTG